MNKDLISIIVPVYNTSKYIQRCIDSILQQTYKNIEIIVVDNDSDDCTRDVIEGFSDSRIVYHKNGKNLGMVGNWNRCLSLAQGEFIQFVCADDVLDRRSIEKKVLLLLKKS